MQRRLRPAVPGLDNRPVWLRQRRTLQSISIHSHNRGREGEATSCSSRLSESFFRGGGQWWKSPETCYGGRLGRVGARAEITGIGGGKVCYSPPSPPREPRWPGIFHNNTLHIQPKPGRETPHCGLPPETRRGCHGEGIPRIRVLVQALPQQCQHRLF